MCLIDLNECENGTNDCDLVLAICKNTIGSFTCHCKPGFIGDGKSCSGTVIFQPLLTVAIQLNNFKSVKVITKSLRHPSHFLENLMGKIGCPSSKYRKIYEFSVYKETLKRIKNKLKENVTKKLTKYYFSRYRILILLIHNKVASQCKMQISECALLIGNVGGFLEIQAVYRILFKLKDELEIQEVWDACRVSSTSVRSCRLLKEIFYGEVLKVNRIVFTDFQHK